MKSLARKPNEKLSPCYYKAYQIIEKEGPVAYHLVLLPICQLHPIFHVSHVKKVVTP